VNRGVNGGRRAGRLSVVVGAVLACMLALAGCQSKADSATSAGAGTGQGAAKPVADIVPAADVTITPADAAAKVRLDKAITVTVAQGTLSTVTVTSNSGKVLKGSLSDDQLTWTSNDKLAPGTTYKVSVDAAAKDGKTAITSSSFKTLTPKSTATASIQPGDGWTVGVGMPVIVNFSTSVSTKNRATVEKAMTVSTASDVEGAWHWMSSQQAQWRPKVYWPANTKVTVTADLAGVEVASGVWGATKKRTSDFTVGSAMISTVDVAKHTLTVRKNGKVLRVIPVTTGKADMATRNGIKIIMSRETSHEMDSASIGIDKGEPGYYDIVAKYAMRLTNSGEFFHAAPWSTGAQGRANVSHGCTGMSTADASWFFSHSKVGDVAVFKNSNRKLEWGNGYTAWNEPFSTWSS
jgi:lipoprotein-anchoring transpeptidase ErfK/SrfK